MKVDDRLRISFRFHIEGPDLGIISEQANLCKAPRKPHTQEIQTQDCSLYS